MQRLLPAATESLRRTPPLNACHLLRPPGCSSAAPAGRAPRTAWLLLVAACSGLPYSSPPPPRLPLAPLLLLFARAAPALLSTTSDTESRPSFRWDCSAVIA